MKYWLKNCNCEKIVNISAYFSLSENFKLQDFYMTELY